MEVVAEEVPLNVPLVVVLLLLVAKLELLLYVESLLGPPQYSSLSPLQSMEQPDALGSLPPGARTDPAAKLFPQ